ncbi:MAG: OmpH family outer membrane protein [Planctomycetes bacterium]|nr:OmpH family outer membrane protein [Planctomycetota bacterium]MCB9917252.1 OmpH family outer membrane protein [Planctomycetota bacterium]
MTLSTTTVCSFLALGLGLGLPLAREAAVSPDTATENAKIAIVDTSVIRKASKWAQGVITQVDQQSLADRRALDGLMAERDNLKKKLELLEPDSRDAQLLKVEYSVMTQRLQGQNELYSILRERAMAEAAVQIREWTQKAVADIAQKRGIDLCLQQNDVPAQSSLIEKFNLLRGQLVLYATPTLDISEDVVKLLDSGFANGDGKANAVDAASKKSDGTGAATQKPGGDGNKD